MEQQIQLISIKSNQKECEYPENPLTTLHVSLVRTSEVEAEALSNYASGKAVHHLSLTLFFSLVAGVGIMEAALVKQQKMNITTNVLTCN